LVFASFLFLFWFLPLFVPLYFAAPRRARNLVLTLGSFVFYGWCRPWYPLLMLFSISLDYVAARAMGRPDSGRSRRAWLWFSLLTNLGLLGVFKYANLFVGTWNDLTPWPVAWTEIVLPVGISFFTFQSMSYTIDVYRGDVEPERNYLDLVCFVSMFPQLVAGPIVRYADIQHELRHRSVDVVLASNGLFLFALGFAKKVLIADSILPLVDHVYALDAPGSLAAWLAAFAYSFQVYFDFSGYSDMAIGLGWLVGFHFPSNFMSPYRSRSMTELWRRWHISLSTWLRDYVYKPLGGNRAGDLRTAANLMITMLVAGFWHGAAWTFVLFGAYHGTFLVLERRLDRNEPYGFLPPVLQVATMFLIWTIGLVLFRSWTMHEVWQTFGGMVGANGVGGVPDIGQQAPFAFGAVAVGCVVAFAVPRGELLVARFHPFVMLGALAAFLLAVCHLLTGDFVSFIYYQF
jgi:alginate O-acetyltransferase complex protein AlgI